MSTLPSSRPVERLALIHGIYYLITGLWPLLDLHLFMAVSGPKNDWWLVRTVGALITCSGALFLFARARHEVNSSIILLATSNAFALLFVDVYYVHLKIIGPVYLFDAVAELVLLVAWLFLWRRYDSVRVS